VAAHPASSADQEGIMILFIVRRVLSAELLIVAVSLLA
jgi:hypothetical protein